MAGDHERAIDPYKVLHVNRNFTAEELRSNYKRLALQLHPDKNIVSAEEAGEIFKVLTHCYKQLMHEHQMRTSDRQFDELRATAAAQIQGSAEAVAASRRAMTRAFDRSDGRFDATRFNQFFSEHRLSSDPAGDKGYGEWLKSTDPVDRPRPAAADGKARLPKECKELLLHVDAAPLAKSRLAFSEMGVEEIDDFSVVGSSRHGVCAMDLRAAYSAKRDDDDDAPDAGAARPEYRNMEELERARAGIRYTMNDSDAKAWDTYREYTAQQEAGRQSHVRAMDVRTGEHHGRLQKMLLAGTSR